MSSQLSLQIVASDSNKSAQATITVQLTDINDHPSGITLSHHFDAMPDDSDTRIAVCIADIQVFDALAKLDH